MRARGLVSRVLEILNARRQHGHNDYPDPETMVHRPRLHGRVAFVTGGTRGIGGAICSSLAEQGADAAAGYSRDRETAEAFIGKLTQDGLKGSIHQGNIASAEDCRRTVGEVIEQHGRLVVNLSSVMGEMGNIGQANYAASKSGLFGRTKTRALEAAFQLRRAGKLEEDGIAITVNTVAPGFVATEMLEQVPEKVLDGIREKIPVGRLGRPDEIARVVHFLVADQSCSSPEQSRPSTAEWACDDEQRRRSPPLVGH